MNAVKFVNESINLIRNAKDPNPFRTMSDEEIAGELLKAINKKKGRIITNETD